ncbi:acyltransferase [Pseudoalteromonas sp. SWXJZ94C]|uniref:acyltransferase family protein n=1 Tax=unclassified Pseudoalteromonas TaxID=194690 RepID=UPI00140E75E5|nr:MULTISPECIES: acyltransferase family protein [unclassified Pseudoalteromonas]MBH0057977.1 acyltransferase [Pseudoalteromonas sp. SWXJZ94C]
MNFRKDINGLRAIAVIAVVLFHFNASWMPGGFAGVDVFFVISGFLMTSIIIRGFERERFSIISFYLARASRIIPALAALCFVLLVFGWFFLIPSEFQLLGKHAGSSIGFISNIAYWRESGYFDAISHEKWLLHTWSLSVEWQFYLIYPVLLVVMQKIMSVKRIKIVLLIGTILGFIYCVYITYSSPNFAYYFLPSRAWEMMLGGIAYLYPLDISSNRKKMTQWLGFFLILGSYIFISKENIWPGYLALIPCFGAFLILQANQNDSLLTSNIVFQKLGYWSYSIYLWHWPLTVYYYESSGGNHSPIIYIILSVLLGWLSYKYIECIKLHKIEKITFINLLKFKPLHYVLVISFSSIIIFISNGVNWKFRAAANSPDALYLKKYQKENYVSKYVNIEYKQECNFFDGNKAKINDIPDSCINNGEGGIFLWGDSHAQALSYGLRSTFTETVFNQVATSGCRPLVKEDILTKSEFKIACDKSNTKAKNAILQIKPKIIILAQKLEHDKNNYFEIKNYLDSNNINASILLIGPVPQWRPSLPKAIVKRHFNPSERYIKDVYFVEETLSINSILKERYSDSKINYISIIDALCNDNNKCLAKIDDKNTPLIWDYGHLSLEGSMYIAQTVISSKIKKILLEEMASK